MKSVALVVILSVYLSALPQGRPRSNWVRATVKDEMTDAKSLLLSTQTRIPGSDRRASLNVACYRDGSVLIFIMAQYTVIEQPPNKELTVRFDNDEPGVLRWSREDDFHTLSSLNPRELLDDYLLDSNTFRIEFTEYPATPHIVTFHVAGLRSAIKGHCGIK